MWEPHLQKRKVEASDMASKPGATIGDRPASPASPTDVVELAGNDVYIPWAPVILRFTNAVLLDKVGQ